MGIGDQMMAAGLAETAYAANPVAGPVAIKGINGAVRWSALWAGNPAIGHSPYSPSITCGGSCLPYLVYPRVGNRLTFSPTFKAREHRAHLYLTESELDRGRELRQAVGGPYIVIEPHGRDRKNINRQWNLRNWQAVVDQLVAAGIQVVQCFHTDTNLLDGPRHAPANTVREGAAILAYASLVVAPEGGIPFLTAALGVPTVVLWGGCVSHEALHFPEHVNLIDPDPESPCGMLVACEHCDRVWARLSPAAVTQVVLDTLAGRRHRGAA